MARRNRSVTVPYAPPGFGSQLGRASALVRKGRFDDASKVLNRIILKEKTRLPPELRIQTLELLADTEESRGDLEKALRHRVESVKLAPESSKLHFEVGRLLQKVDRFPEAIVYYQRCLQLDPDCVAAYNNMGLILRAGNHYPQAVACFRKALQLSSTDALLNLGLTYYEMGLYGEAIESYRKYLRVHPAALEPVNNLTNLLNELGQHEEAIQFLNQLLDKDGHGPDTVAILRYNRSFALMNLGRLEEAWEDYEYRVHVPEVIRKLPAECAVWDGDDLAGKDVVVLAEQGVGDEILYASCFPDLIRAAKSCAIQCDARLASIFKRSFPEAVIVANGRDDVATMARTQGTPVYVLAGSLPRWCRPTLDSFPPSLPYLAVDPDRRQEMSEWVSGLGAGLKVGISWRSMVTSRGRSKHLLTLTQLLPVLGIAGAQFINLQYDDCEAELAEVAELGVVIHQKSSLDLKNDLDGACALTSVLDVVVTPPTAVWEIAGAVGVKALVPTLGRDRIRLGAPHCPWYPNHELFIRSAQEGWDRVVQKMAARLAQIAAARGT